MAHQHHDVVEKNTKNELIMTLVGVLAFASIVLLISVSSYLRPAGQHIDVAKLNAEAASSGVASTPISVAQAVDASAVSTTDAVTVPTDSTTVSAPNTSVDSPDNAVMTPASEPTAVAKQSTINERNASTAEAKGEIKENTGALPDVAPPVASAVDTPK